MLRYADEMGIMVIAETPFVGLCDRMYRQDILDKANLVIEEMIARDKNHPSIVMWSLANEPGIGAEKVYMIRNIIVGQSGGPTAVINASLAGVYKTAKDLGVGKVYGMRHGIQGFLERKIVDLDAAENIGSS